MKLTNMLWAGAVAVIFTSCGSGEEESSEAEVCASTEVAECESTEEIAECESASVTYGYTIDAEASSIEWNGEQKLQGKTHTGTINITEGGLNIEEGIVTGGMVTVDMTSITNTDLAEDQGKAKLEGHLKSPDFFDAEQFPTASFEIKGGEEGTLSGTLTIKGIAQDAEVTDVVVSEEEGTVTASGKLVFDRSKFEVKYGSGSFFEDLGDKIISDEIGLTISLSAAAE